jgi:hypothetical protein
MGRGSAVAKPTWHDSPEYRRGYRQAILDAIAALERFQRGETHHHYLDPSGFIKGELGGDFAPALNQQGER